MPCKSSFYRAINILVVFVWKLLLFLHYLLSGTYNLTVNASSFNLISCYFFCVCKLHCIELFEHLFTISLTFFFFISLQIRIPTRHSDQDNTSLIVSVAVPFALLAVFCVIVSILYVRRKRIGGRRTTKEARATDSMSLADSEVEINRPILIRNFADHYRLMSADSDFR